MASIVAPAQPLHARLSKRRWKLTASTLALSTEGAILVAEWAGRSAVGDGLAVIDPGWIELIVVLTAVAVLVHMTAHRAFARLDDGPRIAPRKPDPARGEAIG